MTTNGGEVKAHGNTGNTNCAMSKEKKTTLEAYLEKNDTNMLDSDSSNCRQGY